METIKNDNRLSEWGNELKDWLKMYIKNGKFIYYIRIKQQKQELNSERQDQLLKIQVKNGIKEYNKINLQYIK